MKWLFAVVAVACISQISARGDDAKILAAVEEIAKDTVLSIFETLNEFHKNVKELKDAHSDIVLQKRKEMATEVLQAPSKCTEEEVKAMTVEAFSYDACANLSDDLADAEILLENGWKMGEDGVNAMTSLMGTLVNCQTTNPISSVKCFAKTLGDIKAEVTTIKTNFKKFETDAFASYHSIKFDFHNCFSSSDHIEKIDNKKLQCVHKSG